MTINYHTIVKFPQVTGIPADAAENTFSWIMPGALLLTDMTEIHAAVQEFYNVAPTGGTFAVGAYLGDQLTRAADAVEMKTYAIPALGGPLGAPVDVANFTLTSPAGTSSLPSEIAACLSFHGDYAGAVEFAGSTRPRARLRGRIYLGPLGNNTNVSARDATTKRENILSAFRVDATLAAARLRDRTASQWGIWSRTTIGLVTPVTGGWMDDAFDVQRRRGEKALLRTSF